MKRLLFYIFIGMLVPVALAQDNVFSFERITTDNGLSKNNVYNITQDSIGFMWFGTDYGLNRYDGYEFRQYLNISGDTSSLKNNYISSSFIDNQGNLWVVTNECLNLYHYETDNFTRYPLIEVGENTRGIQRTPVIQDRERNLWIGNTVYGLFKFNTKDHTVTDYRGLIDSLGISSLYQDKEGFIWIGGDRGMLFRLNVKNNEIDKFTLPIKTENLHDVFIFFIKKYDNNFLITGSANGLFLFNKRTKKFTKYELNGIETQDYSFSCYYSDSSGSWFGTSSKGLLVSNGKLKLLDRQPNNLASLSNNEVKDIFKDKSGVYWIATMGGINKFDPRRAFFAYYQYDPGKKYTLTSNNVSSFCEDKDKNVWIGIMGGGINVFNPVTNKFYPINDIAKNVPEILKKSVFDFCVDDNGYIWIATYESLFRYDQKKKLFKQYDYHYYNPGYLLNDNIDKLDGKAILSIAKSLDGDLWLGTYGGGLTRITFNKNTKEPEFTNFKHERKNKNSLSNNYIRKVFIDRFGIVWIGTLGSGLERYDVKTNTFTHYSKSDQDSTSARINYVTEIYEDHFGNLWVGTYSGLYKFNREDEVFHNIVKSDSRPFLMISEVFMDRNSNLWITTDNGLYKYNLKKKSIRKFGVLNGLQGNNFNINALYEASDGSVYIGGRNGFNVFKPDEYTSNKFVPEVVITGINVDNKPVKFGYKDNRVIFSRKKGETSIIDLTYKNKVISINYAALSYSLNKQNSYAYKLEGLNNDWVYTEADKRVAMFTNLTPGKYTFRVKASNSDGVWNENGTSLDIVMEVPYWKTWWAVLIYVFIVLGIMLLIIKFILIKKKLENDLLVERLDRERIIEINKMKIEFFSNVSHEFRTPLTLILSPVESLLKDVSDTKVAGKLKLIKNNATRLLNLVNQLLDFRKSETDKWTLNTEKIDLIEFVEDIKSSFNELASRKNIIFELKLELPRPLLVWFDRMKMKSVVYNLLSNAFKYTPDGKKISIVIRKEMVSMDRKKIFLRRSKIQEEEYVVIEVKDEGKGIEKSKLPYIFDRFYTIEHETDKSTSTSTGIGLTLVKKILLMHNGQITVESSPDKGSKFSAFIPLGEINKNESPDIKEQTDIKGDEEEEVSNIEVDEFAEAKIKDSELLLILIVEDDEEIRQYIIDELKHKFKFVEAKNGMEGLAIAREMVPDLIISDVIMPQMDGIEMCNKLKDDVTTNHIPVILLTAKASDEDKLVGIKTGADSYLTKPFNIDLLEVNIENLLESRAQLRKKYSNELFLKPKDIVIEDADGKLLADLIEIIENNMSDPEFSVKTLSNEIGLSRMQLYRKLKAIVNKTPHELINTIRMERAAQILVQKKLTISEVAYEVGFNTPKYFSRCFKEEYGMLPTQYIKSKTEEREPDNNIKDGDNNND